MSSEYDVAIVGGGIVGLAQAWRAAARGKRVVLLERDSLACGASVRNFGMIWPIGQPAGALYETALHSRTLWLELAQNGALNVEECGSIHLAHEPDELRVLEEFCELDTHQVGMLTPEEIQASNPLVNGHGLLGGMQSPTEMRVDPRSASSKIAAWLHEQGLVDCRFNSPVVRAEDNKVVCADGQQWRADTIVICSGSDLSTLYPEVLRASGLQLCKLQMLKTGRNPITHQPARHLASGLTLRHYESFRGCPSLGELQQRIGAESPELDRFGIHVMASQFPDGSLILGDSHEYGEDITPFDKREIDELVLRELRKILVLDDWTIQERWHGIYAKHPQLPVFETQISDSVRVFVGTGGAGMTMSFGLAEDSWRRWLEEE